jgi:hypothetical protein
MCVCCEVRTSSTYKRSKPIPRTGRGGLYVCEMLRTPHCLDNRLTDGGEDVGLTRQERCIPQKHLYLCLWYSFLSEAEQTTVPTTTERSR